MRNPKKPGKPAKAGPSKKASKKDAMETDVQHPAATASVWRPGIDPMGEDEELDYDPTAYDCLHKLQLDWPCLSFDFLRDELGGPRSTFPHTCFMVAGTQASMAKQNYVAFLRLANLGQGRHGKKAQKAEEDESEEDEDSMSDSDEEGKDEEDHGELGPPRMHYRMVSHHGGVNRVRSCPQQPGVVAVWGDNAQVKVLDGMKLLKEMSEETEVPAKSRNKLDLRPLAQHGHAMEGYAMDWSKTKAGRLATGDCRRNIHVWEPQEGGRWSVSAAYAGHESSVEDIQWSPTEETVFASGSADNTLRVWDTRERAKPMISIKAHDSDVNVVSWNGLVTYMMASGADDGSIRIWDLRSFSQDGHVSNFNFHRDHVTGIEWCPYEGSMLASSAADNQVAVWDLALERDPEEEASLAPEGNAAAPEELPAQLLFLHLGHQDLKECHWHPQIPGLIGSTDGVGFTVFKASNM